LPADNSMIRISAGFTPVIYCLILSIAFSCVPRQKVIYLQNQYTFEDSGDDTVRLSYDLQHFEYQLRPGDVLDIRINSITPTEYDFFSTHKNDQDEPLLNGYKIDQLGSVQLPVLGNVKVAGMTIKEAEVKLTELVTGLLRDPTVTINILNYRFTVLGEVNKPGEYKSYDSDINFFEAIAMAGDMSDFANRQKIQFVRYNGDQAEVSFVDVLNDEFLSSDQFHIRPNDFIFVPPSKVKNIKRFQLANFGIALSAITAISLLLIRTN